MKVRASQSLAMTLVAPFWPQCPCFPELLDLLTEPPLPLPSRWDLLRQPHARKFHRNLSMLRLHAWRLSSDLREPLASLVACLDDLGRRGGPHQLLTTSLSDLLIVVGARRRGFSESQALSYKTSLTYLFQF